MVDFVKKVYKEAAGDLAEGEPVLDARVVQPAGKTMRDAFSSAVTQQAGTIVDWRVQQWRVKE